MKNIKYYLIIFVSLFTFISCASSPCKNLDTKTCPVLKDFQVFNKNSQVHFSHLCSGLDYDSEYARQSYILFQGSYNNSKALVLAKLRLGWLGIQKSKGLAIDFLEIKIKSLWSSVPISFSLLAKDKQLGNITEGAFVNTYLKGPDTTVNYQLDPNGNINWSDFLEPEVKSKASLTNHPFPAPSIPITELSNSRDYQLFLVVKNDHSKQTINLAGPDISISPSLLDIKKPEARVLGFFDTLNPFQKGGLFHWVSTGVKYDKCIYARKKARKEFQRLFNE